MSEMIGLIASSTTVAFVSKCIFIGEIYKFASRIAESNNVYDNELVIRIELHNMKNRSLVEIRRGEVYTDRLWDLHYSCRDNDLVQQKELALSDLIRTTKELAIDHTLSVLNKFEWSSASYLEEQQKKLFMIKSKGSSDDFPISIDDPSRDKKIFRDRLMQEICRRYKYLRRNTDSYEFVFSIEDIRNPGMMGFEKQYFIQKLPEPQDEDGYIEILPLEKFRLTSRGIQYCDDLA